MVKLDAPLEIRRAVDTGEAVFGSKETEKSILKGNSQLVIISSNAPTELKENLKMKADVSKTPVYSYEGSGLELGSVCGKPFVVLSMSVLNAGKSKVLSLVSE